MPGEGLCDRATGWQSGDPSPYVHEFRLCMQEVRHEVRLCMLEVRHEVRLCMLEVRHEVRLCMLEVRHVDGGSTDVLCYA